MKYFINFFSIIFFTIVFCSSCGIFTKGFNEYKSAKTFHNNGNFYQAALYSAKALKLNAKNKKALKLFKKSFKLASNKHKTNIVNFEKINDNSKWPKLYYVYDELKNLNNELISIRKLISSNELNINSKDYSEELNRVSPLAAEYAYNEGLFYRSKKDKKNQKMAAKAFKSAQNFVPNYKNSTELYNEARKAALITLMVIPFNGDNDLVNYIRNRLMMIQSTESKEFLQIISRDHVSSILDEQKFQLSGMVDSDQVIEIGELSAANQILSASLVVTNRPPETIVMENIKQEKNIVVREETYFDDEGVKQTKKIKETVYATVSNFKKSAESTLILTYQISDLKSGLLVYTDKIRANSKFYHTWATYQGDKRALSSTYKRLVKTKEKFAPSSSELSMQASEKITKKLIKKISDYYSN